MVEIIMIDGWARSTDDASRPLENENKVTAHLPAEFGGGPV